LLDFLAKRNNSSFPERKPIASASGNKEFPDGNYLTPQAIFFAPARILVKCWG